MEIIFRKWHIRAGVIFGVILFSFFFFTSSGVANEDIFLMVEKGDIDGVREIIEEIEDINIRNEN